MNYSSLLGLPAFLVLFLIGGLHPSKADDSSPAPAPGVLYTNDFTTSPINTSDTRWWVSDPAQISWVQDVVHGGKGSLKLTNPDKTKNIGTFGPFIPYTGPSLTLSLEAKLDSVITGVVNPSVKAAISVYYYDQDRHEINTPWPKYHDSQGLPDGSQDWQTYEKTFFLPAGTSGVAFARIAVTLPGSGTIWIDKVSLSQKP